MDSCKTRTICVTVARSGLLRKNLAHPLRLELVFSLSLLGKQLARAFGLKNCLLGLPWWYRG